MLLAWLDRADGADKIGKDLAAVLQLRTVLSLERHVIALMRQQNQKVFFKVDCADDGLEQLEMEGRLIRRDATACS